MEEIREKETHAVEVRPKKGKSKAVSSSGPSSRTSQGARPKSGAKTISGTYSAKTISGISDASSSTRKRKLESQGAQASTESSSKRAKTSEAGNEPVLSKEAQLLKYINQVMSHNVRSYAIGMLIQDDKLRVVYGDRMGVVFTERINFLTKDAHLFLLLLAAIGSASVRQLGIHPNAIFPKENADDIVNCVEIFDEEHGYEGAILRLEGQGEDGSKMLEYDFDVDEKAGRSVYTEFGLIGRGTTVIPVKARVNEGSLNGQESEELVAKVAWPHAVRTGEDVFIRKVRKCLEDEGKKSMLQHIVDLKASLTKNMEAMDLPRYAMGLQPEPQDVRVCRILILKRYRPLDTIGSPAKFHQVFVQVVRGTSLTVVRS